MRTDVMIKQLRKEAKKHENDKLYTFETNISLMCSDCANRLEELEKENQEIRNKTIEEFVAKADDMLGSSDRDIYCKETIREIMEQMKGGK